jgi:ATP-dependent Lon protease
MPLEILNAQSSQHIKEAAFKHASRFAGSLKQPAVLQFPQIADRFVPQLRFGAAKAKAPFLPEAGADDLKEMTTAKLLNVINKSSEISNRIEHSVMPVRKGEETYNVLSPLHLLFEMLRAGLGISANIESIQENPGGLDPRGKFALATLNAILPPEARLQRFNGKLEKIFSGYLKDDLAGILEDQTQMEAFLQPYDSPSESPENPIRFTESNYRFLGGFAKRYPKSADLTLENLVNYLLEAENKPGTPKDINLMAGIVRRLREEVMTGVRQGTLIKPVDQYSVDGLRIGLSQLYDESKPIEQRLISQDLFEHLSLGLNTLQRMQPGSPNYEMERNRLHEIIYRVPYTEATPKDITVKQLSDALDAEHYGMKEVKGILLDHYGRNRYIQHQKEKGIDTSGAETGQILCLVGPPGVGKTTLIESYAKAMGLPFQRVALGGVRDEADIRGHRSTYTGSKPGEIIDALKRAKSKRLVMCLDELDKLSSDDIKGAPADALLEVLDPKQNKGFRDHYLGVETDLSKVDFVCTANELGRIPAALRNRLQIVEVPSYTEQEKVRIAFQYLIPRARIKNVLSASTLGLAREPFQIARDAVVELITRYAKESGVRRLEQRIDRLASKIAANLAEFQGKITGKLITLNNVHTILGAAPFDLEPLDPTPVVGRVNAMYYSDGGGGAFPIDAMVNTQEVESGKGGFDLKRITGKYQDTIKESAQRAFDYLVLNAKRFDLQEKLKTNMLNVYIAAASLNEPKDGPSAGIAHMLAVISAATNRPIRGDMAVTGAADMRGNVGKIGGVREKVSGSVAQGAKLILIPEANAADIETIPEEVRCKAEIRTIKTLDEAIALAFQPE